MKPWMIAALLGALFGLTSRHWLSINTGSHRAVDPSGKHVHVHVIIGIGNRIIYNPGPSSLSDSSQESSHAEGA